MVILSLDFGFQGFRSRYQELFQFLGFAKHLVGVFFDEREEGQTDQWRHVCFRA
jgi:hypothetical protein